MSTDTGPDPPGTAPGSSPPDRPDSSVLPVVGSPPSATVTRADVEAASVAACSLGDEGCITCGDVALPLTVVEIVGADARCRAADGRQELVATDLVGDVAVGDLLLVHAGVALERLDPSLQHDDRRP